MKGLPACSGSPYSFGMGPESRSFLQNPAWYVLSMFWYGQNREIKDHAGRVCTCWSPSVFGSGKNAGTGAMTKAEYRLFVRGLRTRHVEAWVTRVVGVLAAFYAIQIGADAVTQFASLGVNLEAFLRLAWASALVLFAVFSFTCPGIRRDKLRRELLRAGRCACCAFDLSTLPPDTAGLVQCPECGARWRGAPSPVNQGASH